MFCKVYDASGIIVVYAGITYLILESDLMVREINTQDEIVSLLDNVVQELKSMMKRFSNCKV